MNFKNLTFLFLLIAFACTDNDPRQTPDKVEVLWSDAQLIDTTIDDIRVYGVLVLPEQANLQEEIPAVVIMHGSGGMWVDNIPGGTMAKQFRDWADTLRNNNFAGLFIDSYSVRGIEEFHEVPPPDNAVVAAEYVRPRDAYAALQFLRKLYIEGGAKIVQSDNVMLMGFSHGGTSVLSTVVDTGADQIKSKATWTQRSSGVTYDALPPVPAPEEGGFKACVAYYPGCGFYSYFGNVKETECIYVNYCPVLILAAENDALYTGGNTEGLFSCATQNNGNIRLEVMPDANHSFDGKSTGSDGAANIVARTEALAFFKEHAQ